MVLSYIRKYVSGWTNPLEIVTSHRILEREMGNRGSKSSIAATSYSTPNNNVISCPVFVNEQRVDGG